jgi:hypothetical protein
MSDPTDDNLRQDIMSLFTTQVGGGFRDREEIWVEADDLCEQSSNPDAMRKFASSELDRLWKEQRAAEATWPERTDCDRLDAAFEELEGIGIVCRQDFTCCSTCGGAEIGAECADVERTRGITVRGYAFYHMQDTESAVEGYGVYLSYGADNGGEEPARAVAREIIAVLKNHGLDPQWNGEWSKKIHVPLIWRRRLVCR